MNHSKPFPTILLILVFYILSLLISGEFGYSADTIKVAKELHQIGTIEKLIDYPAGPSFNSKLKSTTQLNYCDYVDCRILAQDFNMQYLGLTSQNQYDPESIINDYGDYGSRYSSTSIRNSYSLYGSLFSNVSAYNTLALNPPILYKLNNITQQWEKVAYLTKNTYLYTGLYPKLDPDVLINTLESGVCLPPPITGLPNIQITNMYIEETSFNVGDFVTLHFTVLNNSVYTINNAFYIEVWQDLLKVETYLINGMTPLGYAEGILQLQITTPMHVIGAYSDVLNNVLESIELDNSLILNLFANMPDLSINNIALEPIGDSVNVGFGISNIGLANVNDTISILLQNNAKPTIYRTRVNLNVNTIITLHKNLIADQDTNKVFIVLDYFNNVIELNEQNNVGYNYILIEVNQPPEFTSTALISATVNNAYNYNITTRDNDGDALTITAPTKPEWLEFTDHRNGTALLSGTPNNSHIGAHNVKLRVNDETTSFDQDFIIIVTDKIKPPTSIAQEVISSGGDYSVNSGGSISYTIGETVIETFTVGNYKLTQGFQQTNLVVTAINELHGLNYKISAFPNPAAEFIKLIIDKESFVGMQYMLYDLNGRLLLQKQIEDAETEITFEDLSPAIYILKVADHNHEVKSFKIVKTQ